MGKLPYPPPWQGTQPETGEVVTVETKELGKGKSVEYIRCYEGTKEVPCGGCSGMGAQAEEASMGGGGQRFLPSSLLITGAHGPGLTRLRRKRSEKIFKIVSHREF